MENLLSIQELEEKIKNLVGIEKWYYDSLPDVCLSSEDTQVNNLRAKGVNIARTKLRRVKNTLIKEGLLQLETLPNGNRKNLKHKLGKTSPVRLGGLVGGELSTRYTPEDEEYTHICNIQWSLLQSFTAPEINSMGRIDRIKLYMDCGFIVLPTHYPIFTENGVKCSCRREFDCSHKGKHPIHKYKFIDGLNYDNVKELYLDEFRHNPNLNICLTLQSCCSYVKIIRRAFD